MPVAKKERTDRKCLWQRKKDQNTNAGGKWKMPALIRQADTKWKKHNSWNHLKNPNGLPTCKHKAEKKNPKTTPNHNILIDYCLQQRSGRLQS